MSDPKFYCRAEDLAIGYGKTPLMEHIGLGVEKGSILTLIGPNGAGKSTLLKTLAAQLAPQGGAVLLDGKDLADYSGPERARKMALMVPHTRRTELTTCFEMASAGRYPYTGRLGVLSAEDKRQVHAALALVGVISPSSQTEDSTSSVVSPSGTTVSALLASVGATATPLA